MEENRKINVHVSEGAEGARLACAERLSTLLEEFGGKDVCILLSGGSALAMLSDVSRDHVGPSTTLCVVDERFLVDEVDRNYYQLLHNPFVQDAIAAGARVLDTRLDAAPSLAAAEEVFEVALRSVASYGRVITLLGIGPDGHAAGIMPFPEDEEQYMSMFHDDGRPAVGYDVGDKNPFSHRVTASGHFLEWTSDHALVYAVGDEKKSVLADIVATGDDEYVLPGRMIHRMRDVHLFTDQDIAVKS